MTPEQWKHIGALYQAALELQPQERAAFLAQNCGADHVLRGEVESLLAAEDSAGSFLAAGAMNDAAKILSESKPFSLVGNLIGRYQILSLLGSGGMGEVYLAEDTRLKRRVAIKFLPDYLARNADRLKRFEQEAHAASALNHPNILTIYEIGESDSMRFIVTEFIDGVTVRQRMLQSSLHIHEALDIAIQITSALAAAHKENIVHRDIKPENIMLRRNEGLVKVLDFGLAKATEAETASAVSNLEAPTRAMINTEPGMVLGTVAYMSPEQARGQMVDARTDIWSVGVVLYEMIAGKAPFAGTANEVISDILSRDEPAPLARFTYNVPAELERIVSKALRKEREQRYQTIKDLMLDLQNLKQQSEFEAKLERSRGSDAQGAIALVPGHDATKTIIQPDASSTSRIGLPLSTSKSQRHTLTIAAVLVLFALALVYLFAFRNSATVVHPEIKSLAVLPLANLSGDPTQDYFADGMTEELIASLSKISNLRVISRTSVMQYKSAPKPLKEIARELNVDAIVEGSVLRSGDRVRITVQLIHGPTDRHLWAESYQRELRDVLALQSDLGRAIAHQIKITLTPQEQGLLANARPVNPAALEEYLQGRDYFNQGRNKGGPVGQELLKTSVGHFEQATKLQSDYALAYAGAARANHWVASSGEPEFFPKSKEAAIKALQIEETLAEAHGALAYTLMTFDRDWPASEKEFRRAIQLNRSYSEARHGYALYLSALGRHDEAVREINLAEELDPLTDPLKRNLGAIYINARRFDHAIERFRQLCETDPKNPEMHGVLGRAYIFKGRHEEGINELRTALDLSGGHASRNARLAWAYAVSGNRSEAIKILDERLRWLSDVTVSKVNIASVYAALGNRDEAFAWLEKAQEDRSLQLLYLKVDPTFDSLHSDPRFGDLIRRLGFQGGIV